MFVDDLNTLNQSRYNLRRGRLRLVEPCAPVV
jgi:hypothetical protein